MRYLILTGECCSSPGLELVSQIKTESPADRMAVPRITQQPKNGTARLGVQSDGQESKTGAVHTRGLALQ